MFNLYLYTTVCHRSVNLKLIAISQRAWETARERQGVERGRERGKSLTYLLTKRSTTSTYSLTAVLSESGEKTTPFMLHQHSERNKRKRDAFGSERRQYIEGKKQFMVV